MMVRVVGLEPTRLSAEEPKGDVTSVKVFTSHHRHFQMANPIRLRWLVLYDLMSLFLADNISPRFADSGFTELPFIITHQTCYLVAKRFYTWCG